MISDSVDILDASILNIGIEFEVLGNSNTNKSLIYTQIREILFAEFSQIAPDIGQPFYLTDIFKKLKQVEGVLDIIDIKIVNKVSANHSNFSYSITNNLSQNGRVLNIPQDSIWELKFITDIVGNIR
jgi:hypothetical protein